VWFTIGSRGKAPEREKAPAIRENTIIGKENKLSSSPVSEQRNHEVRDEFMSPASTYVRRLVKIIN
jgi:hypothetical protein